MGAAMMFIPAESWSEHCVDAPGHLIYECDMTAVCTTGLATVTLISSFFIKLKQSQLNSWLPDFSEDYFSLQIGRAHV